MWLSCNHPCRCTSSKLCIKTQQEQGDFWSRLIPLQINRMTAWLHLRLSDTFFFLGCKRRSALCILFPLSNILWTWTIYALATRGKWGEIAQTCNYISCSSHEGNPCGMAQHDISHDQQCSHMQHFRTVGEIMLLFESISWGGRSNRRKGWQPTQTSLQETQTWETSTWNSENDCPNLRSLCGAGTVDAEMTSP